MVAKDEAKKYLRDTPSEQCFWVNNGPIIKNLDELSNVLPEMKDETFHHHVNNEKNDFSSWINNVIGDKKLAHDLLSSRNKESAVKKLRSRLNALKKTAS